ncbi:MAG: hypothetical protein MJE77_24595 [Proteobacteria bacterium]|nr:hypothetical protein [Pseudomonadota bacterium]
MSDQSISRRDQLWQLLPEIYRLKDQQDGHLAIYLEAFGDLLEQIYQTLEQRLADTSLKHCQPWLIPYFADLLDVRLVSPEQAGQRHEIGNAVRWRQRKGRLQMCIEIARDVGAIDVVPQEGHTRVATTARLGAPRLSLRALGEDPAPEPDPDSAASNVSQRPGTPAVTVDVRTIARARQVPAPTAVSRQTDFGDGAVTWQQANRPLGVPCFPDTYQDVSVRTVDLREPTYRRGHHHPKRLLLYTPVPGGFFPSRPYRRIQSVVIAWLIDEADQWQPSLGDQSPQTRIFAQWGLQLEEIRIARDNGIERHWRFFPDPSFAGQDPLVIDGIIVLLGLAGRGCRRVRFENLVVNDRLTVQCERLELHRVAARIVTRPALSSGEDTTQELEARDCLIHTLWADQGTTQLEYCTILDAIRADTLHASDCILMPLLSPDTINLLWLRYSCAPRFPQFPQGPPVKWRLYRLYRVQHRSPVMHERQFGQPGCAVLHPATPSSIRAGAEDGGEMGAYHHRHYCVRQRAVIEKLKSFLPVGIEPVLILEPDWKAPIVPSDSQGNGS